MGSMIDASANCTRSNDARGLGTYLVEILVRHDHVPALLKLVALHKLGVRHFALAVRAPALLLDTGVAFAVELIEGNRAARFGSREHFYWNVDQTNLQKSFSG
jgi:hypothetical protein